VYNTDVMGDGTKNLVFVLHDGVRLLQLQSHAAQVRLRRGLALLREMKELQEQAAAV
jgi:hypothetical protein